MKDTIFALSSGRPPAAISIIRLSGPDAHGAAKLVAGARTPQEIAAAARAASEVEKLRARVETLPAPSGPSTLGRSILASHRDGGVHTPEPLPPPVKAPEPKPAPVMRATVFRAGPWLPIAPNLR